jgi:acyl-CoA thioesterase-1
VRSASFGSRTAGSLRRRAFFGLLVVAGCAPHRVYGPSSTAGDGPPIAITVLGDSLALGTGASDSSRGFTFDVYHSLAITHPRSEITNYAIGGSTAADVLRLQAGRLRERNADFVIVCVGGNDVARGVDPESFARSYDALLAAVRRHAARAHLIAVGVPDVSISPLFADHADLIRRLAVEDDRAARAAAAKHGAAYVDLFAITNGMRDPATFLSADRFHPSDSGHAMIAGAALPVFRRALAHRFITR